MNVLQDRVRSFIDRHCMLTTGDTVIVGVSGGPDSLCLLHVLLGLRERLHIHLHVAHLDHMLRGTESAKDAAFVAKIARDWRLPATIEADDVAEYARVQRKNVHQAAREIRYRFLARLARTHNAQAVAVAHTANDQAETVLMHLLRGAGTAGLRGILPVLLWEHWRMDGEQPIIDHDVDVSEQSSSRSSHPALIRPLLDTPRDHVEAYCLDHHIEPRQDSTNAERQYTRNRIRHELLYQLKDYNPHIITALGQTATICKEDYAFIQAALAEVWPRLTSVQRQAIDFDGAVWQTLHSALQREALRKAYRLLTYEQTLTWEQVERARALIPQGVGKVVELPGRFVLTVGYASTFRISRIEDTEPQPNPRSFILPIPCNIMLKTGWHIESEYSEQHRKQRLNPWEVYLDPQAIGDPLLVRYRQPGDRLRPHEHGGSRYLQDLFVDAKVPRALRATWPIVATDATIVWVVGLGVAAKFVATSKSERSIRLRITQEQGDKVLPQRDEGQI